MHLRRCAVAGCAIGLVFLLGCESVVTGDSTPVGGNGWGYQGGAPDNGSGSESEGGAVSLYSGCVDLCNTLGTCSPTADCIDECQGQQPYPCEDQWVAWVKCVDVSFNGNCQAVTCPDELAAYNACKDLTTCEPGTCTQDSASCSCDGTCNGAPLEQQCFFQSGGAIPCDCYQNGSLIGSCTMSGDACNVDAGCCKYLLN